MIIGTPVNDTWSSTCCSVGGQLCRLDALEDGAAFVTWLDDQPDADEATANSLGLNPSGRIDPDAIERVLLDDHEEPAQRWHRFVPAAQYGECTEPTLVSDPVPGLAAAVRRVAPEGWQQVGVDFRALGTRVELVATVSTADGVAHWVPPREVVVWLRRVRWSGAMPDGAGTTWCFRVGPDGDPTLDGGPGGSGEPPHWEHQHNDPHWNRREYHEELRYLHRDYNPPAWLLNAASEHHAREVLHGVDQPRTTRMAQVFDDRDEQGRPLVFRPVIPRLEWQDVRLYLGAGRLVLEARSTSADELDPSRGSPVPKAYYTDGTWVWPVALMYYLEEHEITPPRDLLDHIRRRGYRPPEAVPAYAVERAKALVLGTDLESLVGADLEQHLNQIRTMIARLGVRRSAYSFEEPLEGGWSMVLDDDGWWSVFCLDSGSDVRKNEVRCANVVEAGVHLLGALTMTADRFQRDPEEALESYECPWEAVSVDPPLDDYEGKILVDLHTGGEVDRFGPSEGNTVFVAGTTLPQRGMTPQDQPGDYRRYRIDASFQAVAGTAPARDGAVGGGTGYVLPWTVAELVAGGWLVEL